MFKKAEYRTTSMRKAQGMPLNTIILAALALVVLFTLLYAFTGQTKIFSKNIGGCLTKGGKCASSIDGKQCKDNYPISIYVSDDCPQDPKNLCCLPNENQQQSAMPQQTPPANTQGIP